MHLFDWFFRQPVTEGEMDEAFESAEIADQRIVSDAGLIGIMVNGSVTQHSAVPDLTIDVSTPMVAYDQQGQRIAIAGTGGVENVDVAVDSSAVSTSVAGGGNEKWVSIFARFDRALSNPRTDGNGATVQFDRDESYEIVVTQGAEAGAGTATRPALMSDAILLGDVLRTFGQTQILTADIDETRKQRAFLLSTTDFTINAGTAEEAMQSILQELQNHIDNVGVAHPASAIDYDAANLPVPVGWTAAAAANDVQAAIDGIIDDLSQSDGGARIGTAIAAVWADASTVASTNVDLVLEEIVSDLSGTGGAARIGAPAFGNLSVGSVGTQLAELDNEKGGLAISNTWTSTNTFSSNFNASGVFNITSNNFTYREASNEAFSDSDTQFRTHSSQLASTTTTVEDIVDLLVDSGAVVGQIVVDLVAWVDNTAADFMKHTYLIGFTKAAGATPVFDTEQVNGTSIQGTTAPSISPAIVASSNTITLQVTYNANITVNYLVMWRVQSANRNE